MRHSWAPFKPETRGCGTLVNLNTVYSLEVLDLKKLDWFDHLETCHFNSSVQTSPVSSPNCRIMARAL